MVWSGSPCIWGSAAVTRPRASCPAGCMSARVRVLGPEHQDTLAARHTLALWTGEAGDPAGARDQFAALLAIRERVSGARDPETLTTRHNLADWTVCGQVRTTIAGRLIWHGTVGRAFPGSGAGNARSARVVAPTGG